MGNIFNKTDVRFFPVPRELVDGGLLLELSGSALKLYLHLLSLAQRHTAVSIETPYFEVRDFAGLHDQAIAVASRELAELNLIVVEKGAHRVNRFVLLNPVTKLPIPSPAGFKGLREHKPYGRSSRTVKQTRALLKSQINSPKITDQHCDFRRIGNSGVTNEINGLHENDAILLSENLPLKEGVLNGIPWNQIGRQSQTPSSDVAMRIISDPIVREMQRVFGARIISGVDLKTGATIDLLERSA